MGRSWDFWSLGSLRFLSLLSRRLLWERDLVIQESYPGQLNRTPTRWQLSHNDRIYGLGLRNFFYAFFFPIAPIIIFCFPKYKVQPNLALTLTQKSRDTHIKSLRQQKLAPQIGPKSGYTRKWLRPLVVWANKEMISTGKVRPKYIYHGMSWASPPPRPDIIIHHE